MQMTLDLRAAEQRAQRGMALAADKACRKVDPLWVDTAVLFLAAFAREQGGREFTIEQARAAVASRLLAPPDLRAWGHVTRIALQKKVIEPAGMARAASSNNSLKTAYRAGQGAA